MVHTDYLWFNTRQPQEFIRITDDVARIVAASGVAEGLVLVSAMHITASVYVNDWEDGLIHDFQACLRSWRLRGYRIGITRRVKTMAMRTSSGP